MAFSLYDRRERWCRVYNYICGLCGTAGHSLYGERVYRGSSWTGQHSPCLSEVGWTLTLGTDWLYGCIDGIPHHGLLCGGQRLVSAIYLGLADRSFAGRPGIFQDIFCRFIYAPCKTCALDGHHFGHYLLDYRAWRQGWH